ncbi:OmpA family protein [Candidatus Thiothrix anitrata]|uniref:OmpA family protein n=1 Tax=Candidatus Thiothrix anitrata TaxID=2823902 RepID=A0ABX7X758_9GAMM|nr:OmpA family protein [Candidatus Thiothrix anitrata]QTR50863.1 OmpA family protein [Candidatus Thiothrix anitrata]
MVDTTQTKQPVTPVLTLMVTLSVATLTLVAVLSQQATIETDLLQRTRQALVEAGFSANNVQFNGRDGTLSGTVSSEVEAEQMLAISREVYGVRDVSGQLLVSNSISNASNVLEMPPIISDGLYAPSKQHEVEKIDLSGVQFAYAQAELNETAVQTLQEVVTHLRKSPDLTVEVSAHTDRQSTALGNMAVTQARADAVRNYLLSQGVNATQVKAQGYGSARPLADNDTEEGRAQNRRIEITVFRE